MRRPRRRSCSAPRWMRARRKCGGASRRRSASLRVATPSRAPGDRSMTSTSGPREGAVSRSSGPIPWKHVTVRVRFREVARYANAGHPETAWTVASSSRSCRRACPREDADRRGPRRALRGGDQQDLPLPPRHRGRGPRRPAPLRQQHRAGLLARARGGTAQEYLGWPFRLTLPDERDDQPLGPRIEIDNVDPRIMAAVRHLAWPPFLTVYIVLASTPDLVEAGPVAGRLTAVDYNASTIAASFRAARPRRAVPVSDVYA